MMTLLMTADCQPDLRDHRSSSRSLRLDEVTLSPITWRARSHGDLRLKVKRVLHDAARMQ